MRRAIINLSLLAAAVAIFVVALLLGGQRGDFGGTDASATGSIEAIDPGYRPWFQPLWQQPGGEVESGLFALQAALGAGVVGFALGSFRERRRARAAADADA